LAKTISIGAPSTITNTFSSVTTTIGRLIGGVGVVNVYSTSTVNQLDLIGNLRLNATGAGANTLSMSAQGGMSGFIEMGNGNGSTQQISIGNGVGGVTSGTITIGGYGGTPTAAGKTTLLGSRDIQIGNATAGTSLVTVRQATGSLLAGHLGHTVRTVIAATAFPQNPGNNYYQFGTISVPAYTVALISVTCSWTAREGISATKHGAVVSETAASGTSIGAGFSFWEERDTQTNSIALQSTDTLCGVYTNTSNTSVTLYVNAAYNQAGTAVETTPTFSGSTSVTKIG